MTATAPTLPRTCRRCNGRKHYERVRKGQRVVEACAGCEGTGRITAERRAALIEAELLSRRETDRILIEYISGSLLNPNADLRRVLQLASDSLEARWTAFDPEYPEKGFLPRGDEE